MSGETNKFERVCDAYLHACDPSEMPWSRFRECFPSAAIQIRRGMAAALRDILADETLPDEAYDWIAELLREAGET